MIPVPPLNRRQQAALLLRQMPDELFWDLWHQKDRKFWKLTHKIPAHEYNQIWHEKFHRKLNALRNFTNRSISFSPLLSK